MKNRDFGILGVGMILFIVLSLSFTPAHAESGQDKSEEYKELLTKIDGKIRALRFDRKITENGMTEMENLYENVFPGIGNDDLRNEIESFLRSDPSNLKIEDFREFRDDIEKLADAEGVELSLIYRYAVLVILGVSISLAFVVNMISRTVVDWEEVNAAKRRQSEIKDNLEKAREENDTKKVHKLQKKQQQFMQEHMGTMFSPMKTMLIIMIPFIIVFSVMRGTYGSWVVAWLPFNFPWPDIGLPFMERFFKGTMASLGFFGWYILSYFGLSQIMRSLLVPSE